MEVVEVEDDKVVKAVVEAAVTMEEVAEEVVEAEEVKTSHVIVVAKKATSARSARRRIASATGANKRDIYSRCARERSRWMAATPEEAPVVDLVEDHGEQTHQRSGSSTISTVKP